MATASEPTPGRAPYPEFVVCQDGIEVVRTNHYELFVYGRKVEAAGPHHYAALLKIVHEISRLGIDNAPKAF